MTRLTSIQGFGGIIAGKDNDNIFKPGDIYDVRKVGDEIILTKIGESDLDQNLLSATYTHIMRSGQHLVTKEEKAERG
jgi:hypothetical protein